MGPLVRSLPVIFRSYDPSPIPPHLSPRAGGVLFRGVLSSTPSIWLPQVCNDDRVDDQQAECRTQNHNLSITQPWGDRAR